MDTHAKKGTKWIEKPHNEVLVSLILALVLYVMSVLIDIYIYEQTINYAVYDNFWNILFFMIIPAIFCFGLKLWYKNSSSNSQSDSNFSK